MVCAAKTVLSILLFDPQQERTDRGCAVVTWPVVSESSSSVSLALALDLVLTLITLILTR